MGCARTDVPPAPSPGWPWAPMDRSAPRAQRRAVGPAHRRPVGGSAGALSALSNLPSPLSAVAAEWSAGSPAPATRRRSPRPRQTRSDRSLRRCHLRGGEKGGAAIGPTRRGKGSKIMAICDRHGLPLAVHVASASPYEPHLVPATLDARFLRELPPRLIGDRGYDSDLLDTQLRDQYGIEMIAPNRTRRHGHKRWPPPPTLPTPLAHRTSLCLAPQLATPRHALGIPRRKLSRLTPTRVRPNPAQAFMRYLLGVYVARAGRCRPALSVI